MLAPVESPFRDNWSDHIRAYLDADDGQTHDETTDTQAPIATDLTDAAHLYSMLCGSPYSMLCGSVEDREGRNLGRSTRTAVDRHFRSANARLAVLLRAAGQCENPACAGQPGDVTDGGDPILEVDHVNDLSSGESSHVRGGCHSVRHSRSQRPCPCFPLSRSAEVPPDSVPGAALPGRSGWVGQAWLQS